MNNIHDLLAKYFSGHATPEEEHAVRSWIELNEENRAEFNLLEKLWNASGEETTITFDTQKAWLAVDAKIQAGTQQHKRSGMVRKMTAIAAAACVVLVMGLWWLTREPSMQGVMSLVELSEVKLQDGSTVYLRRGAEITYPSSFSGNERHVTLEGEAFFEIARDESKPFTISAGNSNVKVLGTSFLVNARNGQVELVVKTGRVEFGQADNANNKVILVANERASLIRGTLVKDINTDSNFIAWQTGRLIFNETPLSKAVGTINDHYNVQIRLNSDMRQQLDSAKITASFDHQPLSSVLNELSQITSYRIRKVSDSVYIISLQ